MLYVIHGSDEARAREKFDALISDLQKKKSDAVLTRLNSISWSTDAFDSVLQSQGLFEKKMIVTLSSVLSNKEASEAIESKLDEIKNSPNIFILLESVIPKKLLTHIEKFAEKVSRSDLSDRGSTILQAKSGQDFNVFSLTDALGARDRKKLWILLQSAYMRGIPAEEIFNPLLWMVRTMLLARNAKNATEVDMKTFVFDKAKRYSKNFKEGELTDLSRKFIELYHDDHRGLTEFSFGLERIALEL